MPLSILPPPCAPLSHSISPLLLAPHSPRLPLCVHCSDSKLLLGDSVQCYHCNKAVHWSIPDLPWNSRISFPGKQNLDSLDFLMSPPEDLLNIPRPTARSWLSVLCVIRWVPCWQWYHVLFQKQRYAPCHGSLPLSGPHLPHYHQ